MIQPPGSMPQADPGRTVPVQTEPHQLGPDLAELDPAELDGLTEPTEAELLGLCPDPYSGPPDDFADWTAGLSAAELDAFFGPAEPHIGPEPTDADAPGLLDALTPGPALAGLSHEVFEAGLGGLSDNDLVGLLGAARRMASWQAAIELYAVGELDGRRSRAAERPKSSRAAEHVCDELAAALTLTSRSADALLGLSRNLARLPMVLAALLAGKIDRQRAEIFAAELSALDDVAAAAVAAALCGLAGSMTTGQLRYALRAMVLMIDPDAARKRAERGRADARVEFWQENSGNGALAGRELPAADAITADRRIAAIAQALKNAGAPGGMDKLRAGVFAALLTGRDPETLLPAPPNAGPPDPGSPDPGSPRPAPPGTGQPSTGTGQAGTGQPGTGQPGTSQPGTSQPGRPAHSALASLTGSVNITMPASAWLGRSDSPGEVPGYGPIGADTCRDLVARMAGAPGSRWCVTLTDRDGRAVAHACSKTSPPQSNGPPPQAAGPPPRASDQDPPGSFAAWLASLDLAWLERGSCSHPRMAAGYRPPAKLRELVKIRQRTCAFPGCRRPAKACDDDHTIAFENGGITCECNIAPLCRRHHRAKQAPGWRLEQPEPGILVWTAPHGRSYTVAPGGYPT